MGLRRALATRLDGPGFAHWLTQQQSLPSESCRSMSVDRRGGEQRASEAAPASKVAVASTMPTLLAYSGSSGRPRTRTHARTMRPVSTHYSGTAPSLNPSPLSSRPMWLSRAALYRCKYAHAQCVAPKTKGLRRHQGMTHGLPICYTHTLPPRPCCRPLPLCLTSSCGWNASLAS